MDRRIESRNDDELGMDVEGSRAACPNILEGMMDSDQHDSGMLDLKCMMEGEWEGHEDMWILGICPNLSLPSMDLMLLEPRRVNATVIRHLEESSTLQGAENYFVGESWDARCQPRAFNNPAFALIRTSGVLQFNLLAALMVSKFAVLAAVAFIFGSAIATSGVCAQFPYNDLLFLSSLWPG